MSVDEDCFESNFHTRERMGHCIMRQVKDESPSNFYMKMCNRMVVCILRNEVGWNWIGSALDWMTLL